MGPTAQQGLGPCSGFWIQLCAGRSALLSSNIHSPCSAVGDILNLSQHVGAKETTWKATPFPGPGLDQAVCLFCVLFSFNAFQDQSTLLDFFGAVVRNFVSKQRSLDQTFGFSDGGSYNFSCWQHSTTGENYKRAIVPHWCTGWHEGDRMNGKWRWSYLELFAQMRAKQLSGPKRIIRVMNQRGWHFYPYS